MFGTIPEWLPDAELRNIGGIALAKAREQVSSFDDVCSTSVQDASGVFHPEYDPHTLSTMLDVQIAIDSAELVTISGSGTYSALTAELKESLGHPVSRIVCPREM
jgi:hypothetical protein